MDARGTAREDVERADELRLEDLEAVEVAETTVKEQVIGGALGLAGLAAVVVLGAAAFAAFFGVVVPIAVSALGRLIFGIPL